ncbi:ATP-dependent RNA helicase RhlE [Ancylomarina subtilis]|uniref:ATP-dependent RNA helicase RhlE n=1 Tax=Ancylomarina subtilis TaxID=1639035 RepID=A0A4Q7VHN8_9BACT|nr:DEAD/DEAH box helicase [Ancylomarina subtilis]RZT95603.1 ATP-dependent RNA helicase RhlE [Ancylomarina subtilis]
MSFTSLGLSPFLLKALAAENYTQPYPIQKEAIPAILSHKDVLGIAKTGSGKTASYVLPILNNFKSNKPLKNRHIKTLVLVPTRELAVQVEEVFKTFALALPDRIKTLAIFGGVSINPQMMAMNGVSILVATPGRLIELEESNAVNLSEIERLVLDEADKMLNLGFKYEMDRIFALLPKKRQNLLFSATLSKEVENIKQLLLNRPEVIKIESKEEEKELIDQVAYAVADSRKGPLLRYLIKKDNLKQVLVFVSSAFKADGVANKLCRNGIHAVSTHGKKSMNSRSESLRRFKTGKIRVLVTTDLLARGIDIEFLPYVVNYELPRSPKDYVHRIGRTGRAESPGEAISFVSPEEEHHFKVIQKKMKKEVKLIDSDTIDMKGY